MPTPASKPRHCRPAAYELFAAQMPRVESSDGLLRAATAIAMHEMGEPPEVGPQSAAARGVAADADAVDAAIEQIAADVFARLNRREPHAIVAHTHAVLFDEMGFTGDTVDYYNPHNSYLPAVLARRRGLPITLSLIYKCVLERLGLAAVGVNAPAHFLVLVSIDAAPMYVDPFHGGRSMSRTETVAQIGRMVGHDVADTPDLLPTATHVQWLARMLSNLARLFSAADRPADAAAMVELGELFRAAEA